MKFVLALVLASLTLVGSAHACAGGSAEKLSYKQKHQLEQLKKKVLAQRQQQQRAISSASGSPETIKFH